MKKNPLIGKGLAVGIILLFVATGIIPSMAKEIEKPSLLLNYLGNHPPIRIIGNDQFTPENGVTGGSGTANDPYIIENWVIISDNLASQGIFINNTDAYFVIRNCTISGFHHPDEFRQGIKLSEVTNGRIEDTKVSECAIGIDIWFSTENKIINCTCSDYPVYPDGYGIAIFQSTNITIISSICYNMRYGIDISESSDITVQKTECYNNTYCGLISENNPRYPIMRFLIEDCTFRNNGYHGIELSGSTLPHSSGSIIRNCSFYSNGLEPVGMGIWINRLWDTTIENCVFNHNLYGLYMGDRTKNIVIKNCSFQYQIRDGVQIAGDPLFLSFAPNTEISYCDFIENDCGLFLSMTRGSKVHHCKFVNNSFFGVLSVFCTLRITLNNFFNNGREFPENGSAGVYIWGSFTDLRNNYWGTPEGPSITLGFKTKNLPIWIVNNSDTVLFMRWFVRCFSLLRPWLSEPVPNAGRQT